MEQSLGSFGEVTESFSKGVASAAVQVNLPATAFGLSLSIPAQVNLDCKILIAYLAAKSGSPVPEAVATFLEGILANT